MSSTEGMEINLVKGAYIDGAFVYVKTPNTSILLDFGVELQNVFEGGGKFRQPKLPMPIEELKKLRVDYIIITHGHLDHCGGFGLINLLWPNAKVLMTRPTFYFTNILNFDTIRVAEKNNQPPLFVQANLTAANKMVEIIENSGWFRVGDVLMRCPASGHIRGANSVIINYKNKNFMYSADICFWDQPTVLGADIRLEEKIDLLLMDATNGAEIFPNQTAEWIRGAEMTKKTLDNGGTVFSPAFAVGRSTDIIINNANYGIEKQYVDGLARRTISRSCDLLMGWWEKTVDLNIKILRDIYHGEEEDGEENEYKKIEGLSEVESVYFHEEREAIAKGKSNCITSTAGVGEFGPASSYIPRVGANPKNMISVYGHTFEGSPTQQLFQDDNIDDNILDNLEKGRVIKIRGQEHIIRSQVEHFQISSHADQKGVLKFIGRNKPKRVVFTHSSREAKNCLIDRLKNSPIKAESGFNGMKMEL